MKRYCLVILFIAYVFTLWADSWLNYQPLATDGTDFWTTFMTNAGVKGADEGLKISLIIVSHSSTQNTITITNPRNSWSTQVILSPQHPDTLLQLPQAADAYLDSSEQFEDHGLHITSTGIISLYAANSGNDSYDATLVLPTNVLTRKYVVQTYSRDRDATEFAIVATRNQTQVMITPTDTTVNSSNVNSYSHLPGNSFSVTLDAGQTYQVRTYKKTGCLSGTLVCSDQPIVVLNGGQEARVPNSTSFSGDHIVEQNVPIRFWGKQFPIVKAYRQGTNVYRITASENNTQVYVNGALVRTLSAYESYEGRLTPSETSCWVEASKHAICYQYLSSAGAPGNESIGEGSYGDPSMLYVTPVEQFIPNITFGTFRVTGSNAEQYINIICRASEMSSIRLDNQPISAAFMDVAGSNSAYKFARVRIQHGAHIIAGGALSTSVYGIGEGESYAYSAGFNNLPMEYYMHINDQRINDYSQCVNKGAIRFSPQGYGIETTDFQSIIWVWGDGTSQQVQYNSNTAMHTYSAAGDYSMMMIVRHDACISPSGLSYESDTVRATIHIRDTYESYLTKRLCQGESEILQGRDSNGVIQSLTITTDTQKDEHFYTIDGCDSIVHIDVRFGMPMTKTVYDTVCVSYTWHGTRYDRSGTYQWTGKTIFGCDSVVTLNLVVKQPVTGPIEQKSICENSSISWNGQTISTAGTYYATLTAANGCDSLCTVVVKVEKDYKDEMTTYVCPNDSYLWRGQERTQAKDYEEHTSSPTGCDSTFILHLLHYPTYSLSLDTNICRGEEFLLGDTTLRTSGTYTRQMTTIHGCDSTVTVRLEVRDAEVVTLCDTICAGESYPFDGRLLTATGTYTMVGTTEYGCGKTTILQLTVHPSAENYDTMVICARDLPLEYVPGRFADKAGDYRALFKNGSYLGCDSTYYLHLEVLSAKITNLPAVYRCDYEGAYSHPDPNTPRLHNLTQSGTYRDTLLSATGCDSILILPFYWGERTYNDMSVRICDTELPWHDPNSTLILMGDTTYNDTITNVAHCDSVITVRFSVAKSYSHTIDTTLCEMELPYRHSDARFSELMNLTESGTYTQTVATVDGCDSTIILNLVVNPTTYKHVFAMECESNLPYIYGEHQKKAYTDGEYRDTLITKNQYGCDSVLVVNLTVLRTILDVQYDTICSSDLPYFHSDSRATRLQNLTSTDVYQDTLQSVSGCDSILELHLFVPPSYYGLTEVVNLCDNEKLPWNDLLLDGAWGVGDTVIVDSLLTIYGCDSVITLTVHIWPTYSFTDNFVVCQDVLSPQWQWEDEDGGVHGTYPIDSVGVFEYVVKHTTIHGCDSVFGLHLEVIPSYRFDSVYTMCEDSRIEWQGRGFAGDDLLNPEPGDTILLPGTYHFDNHLLTQAGCDSSFYLTLHVYPVYDTLVYIHVCQNELPYVLEYTDADGEYSRSIDLEETEVFPLISEGYYGDLQKSYDILLQSMHHCDSMVHVHMTIHPSYEYVEQARICWDEYYEWRGGFYNKTGVYYDSLQTDVWGCDSIYVLELFVKPIEIIPVDTFTCDNQVIYHIDTLWYNEDRWTTIERFVWKPGMDTDRPYWDLRFKGEDGCDSIVYRYSIEIYPTYFFEESTVICSADRYMMADGHMMGTPYWYDPLLVDYVPPVDTLMADTMSTIHGCDSIYLLRAHINPQYRHIDYDTICDDDVSIWRSHRYENMKMGDYVYTDEYLTVNGCDSIYELHLHVNPTYLFEAIDSICADETYLFQGVELNATGFYTDSLITIYGCDSVYHLYLTVLDTTYEIIYDTICSTDTLYLHGRPYWESGSYKDTTLNEWGCHHFTYLHLELIEPTVPHMWADTICSDVNMYEIFYHYTGPDPLEYSIYYDDFGHEQGFEDVIHAPIEDLYTMTIPMPDNHGDKTHYPRPDKYPIRLYLFNGYCLDSTLCTTDTRIVLSYPSWVTEQRFRDVIAILSTNYNGGYEFDTFQWYRNDMPIPGETMAYLYIPQELEMDSVYYYVRVTRSGETESFQTCPIWVHPDDVDKPTPCLDYISVVPTFVVLENPVVDILSVLPGTYTIYTESGIFVSGGTFDPGSNNAYSVTLPSRAGVYIVHLSVPDATCEPERTIKVIVQ